MSGAAGNDEKGDGEEPAGGDAPVPQAGVLGNLPKTRPSVRSPRRKERKQQPEAAASEPPARPDPRPQDGRGRPPRSPTPSRTRSGNPAADLDALARGGIAIAGEAASLGLRIAGRAAAALRDAVERR